MSVRYRVVAVLGSLALVALLSSFVRAQDFTRATAANAKQFVGTWRGSFQGHPFLTVKLAIDGNKLVGSVSHVDIDVDKSGELTKADASEGEDVISQLRVAGDILRISVKGADDSESPIQSEMKLVGSNDADFRLIVPPDVPTPKPWPLKRVEEAP